MNKYNIIALCVHYKANNYCSYACNIVVLQHHAQVYTQGGWNVVCYEYGNSIVTNHEAAAAACRQTGYTTYEDFRSADDLG